jgi:hypothetical protein
MQISKQDYSAWTLSFTVLTDLTRASGCVLSDARAGTNRAENYLSFVLTCIEQKVRSLARVQSPCDLTLVICVPGSASCARRRVHC